MYLHEYDIIFGYIFAVAIALPSLALMIYDVLDELRPLEFIRCHMRKKQ